MYKKCTFTTVMQQKELVRTARITGLWYLLLAISGMLGFMVFHPQVYVTDNPEQTLNNLVSNSSAARIRLLLELIIIVSQALAAAWFYKLFKEINQWAASVLGLWGTVNAVVLMISAISMHAAMGIAASAQSIQEKISLIQLLSKIIGGSWFIGGLFFGLWLLPMGFIIMSSKRMPFWLGCVLIAGGAGYLLQTVLMSAGIQSSFLNYLVLPATVGELWIIGYLLIFGIRPAQSNQPAAI